MEWVWVDLRREGEGEGRAMAGASRGGEEDTNGWRSEFLRLLAMVAWVSGIHVNAFIVIVCLAVLPRPWAFSILALWFLQTFLPVLGDSPLSDKFCRFICKYGPPHFPMRVHVEDLDAFDPKRSYVLGLEPHSVLPISMIVLTRHYGFLPLRKIKCLVTSAIFWTPILRQLGSWMGLSPASRKYFSKLLNDGYSCVVVPGGVQEVLYLKRGSETIFLKKRKGFVRCAIEAGSPLVPCFCFGQTEIYHFWKLSGHWYSLLSRAVGFTPLIFWGMYGTPLPYRHPMYFVVGKPIEVEKNPNPSDEEISKMLSKFIAAMEELFDKHKTEAGYKDMTLTLL